MIKKRFFTVAISGVLFAALLLKNHPVVVLNTDSEARAARYRYSRLLAIEQNNRDLTAGLDPNKFTFLQNTEAGGRAYAAGKASGNLEELDRAEKFAQAALQLAPRYASAMILLAQILEDRHEFSDSIRLAKRARAEGSQMAAYKILVTSYLATGELAEARLVAETMVRTFPISLSYLFRALVNEAQGRLEETHYDYLAAAAREEVTDPESASHVRSLWARFLLRTGDLRRAAAIAHEAVRLDPKYPLALSVRADVALARGDNQLAAQDYYEAFRLSRTARYLSAYGRAKRALGDKNTAADAVTSAIALLRSDLLKSPTAHAKDLAEALLNEGSFESRQEAAVLMQEEVRRRPSVEVLLLNAEVELSLQNWDALGETVSRLFSMGSRQTRLYELAARREQERGNRNRAALFLRLAAG